MHETPQGEYRLFPESFRAIVGQFRHLEQSPFESNGKCRFAQYAPERKKTVPDRIVERNCLGENLQPDGSTNGTGHELGVGPVIFRSCQHGGSLHTIS